MTSCHRAAAASRCEDTAEANKAPLVPPQQLSFYSETVRTYGVPEVHGLRAAPPFRCRQQEMPPNRPLSSSRLGHLATSLLRTP